ncbi:DUF126 domain-containing protein [bacterium]|nr:DUF126 domain-containing protein [bacterium]
MARRVKGRAVVPGVAQGRLLVSSEPLSFWGGYDQNTGDIIDSRHPLVGKCAAGRILAIPFTIGSSTTTAVLLEAIRAGNAPAGILTQKVDSFLALASIVAEEMYGKPLTVVALNTEDFHALRDDETVTIQLNGLVLRE